MSTAQAQPPRPSIARIATLKRRPEFLRIRKGARFATTAFVLEGKRRDSETGKLPTYGPRFGFTVSKKVGSAVERNRIKRRLKAAVSNVIQGHAEADFDYVVVARRAALDAGFSALTVDLTKALGRIYAISSKGQQRTAAHSRVYKS